MKNTLEHRDYTKKELSLLCNPGMDVRSASQKFYRDTTGCAPLMEQLRLRGYNKHKSYLAYWQVRLIVDYVYPDIFDL